MAHFAKLDSNNIVVAINVVNNAVLDPNNEESSGIAFLQEWSQRTDETWMQVSFNGNLYNRYPVDGDYFDAQKQKFISERPWINGVQMLSWILDDNDEWTTPIPEPTDGLYDWDESTVSWVEPPFVEEGPGNGEIPEPL